MIWKRLLGLLFLLVTVLTVVAVVVSILLARRAIDATSSQLEATLSATDSGLNTAVETLQTLEITMLRVTESLATVEESARGVAVTISDTQPLLENVETIAAEDIAGSLQTIEDAIPGLVDIAGAIDDTLTTLNAFQFAQNIPLGTLDFGAFGEVELPTIAFDFDLGIDYEPEQPFDESVRAIGDSLDGVPEQLQDTATQIGVAADNLSGLSGNLDQVADDIAAINDSVDDIPGQLDTYVTIVGDVQTNLRRTQDKIPAQAARIKSLVTLALIWLGLTQLAPLYLSVELLTGSRATGAPDGDDGADEQEDGDDGNLDGDRNGDDTPLVLDSNEIGKEDAAA